MKRATIAETPERFASSTDHDIATMLEDKDSSSTKKATKQAIKVLREYCAEKRLSTQFEDKDKVELDNLLKQFYANARKKDGTMYSKNTMNSIRYGLARYFMTEKKVNIVEDVAFGSSNKVFSALLTQLKRNGLSKVNHHPEITKDDLQKLYLSFDLNTPKGLQQKCMFDIMFHLVRRGRENLREQTKETFAIAVDSQNRRYVYQAVDELDKNHRENDDPHDSTKDGRMYEQAGPLCPVKTFELYLSKLNPELKFLWQRPKQAIQATADNCWYCNVPVGKNTLGSFMKDISRAADLSKQYTNHSIRVTAVTVLDHSNFEARHIMRVSGHKSEASIRSYSRRLSENKQREISETLGLAFGYSSESAETISSSFSPSETLELTSTQYKNTPDTTCISPLPRLSLPGSPVLHASQTNTLKNVTFASGAFNNCNVTFNFSSN